MADKQVPELVSELASCDLVTLSERVRTDQTLVQSSVVAQLADEVRHCLRVNTDRALHLAEASVLVAKQLGDPVSLGLSLRAKANALWFRNDFRSATTFFDEAVTWFEKAGKSEEIGRTLSSSIQSLSLLGEYDRALIAARRARAIFEAAADKRRLARLDINVANIYHRQDRFAEALTLYRRAYDQLIAFRDSEGVGAALHNMAVCLIMLNDFDEAVRTMRLVRQMSDDDMPLLARQAEYNIAYLYFLRGDYDEALVRLRTTRMLSRRDGDAYHEALSNLDESEIYLELNLAPDAARLASEAMDRFRHLAMPFEQGRSAVNCAVALHRAGDSSKALSMLRRARRIFRQENNEAWGALVAVYEAIVLFETGRFPAARARCTHALRYFRSAELDRREIFCQLVLARISLALSRPKVARKLCRAALDKLVKVDAPTLKFQAYLLMGHIDKARSSNRAGLYYERARLALEELRSSIQGDELKIAFMRDKEDLYECLVQLCLVHPPRPDVAFAYVEQAKSRSLMDLVIGRALPILPGTDDERVVRLRRELNWYYHRLEIEQNPKDRLAPERIRTLRQETTAREEDFLRLYRDNWRQNSHVTEGRSDTITQAADEVRSLLAADVSIIEYFRVENRFLALIVTAESVEIVPVANVGEVMESLQMLEFQMARMTMPGRTAETERHLTEAVTNRLRDLYDKVFGPFAGRLKTSELVVVPHGVLHYLPFHALVSDDEYLIDRFTISYAPSARIFAACELRKANTSGASLLLGVPDQMAPWITEEIESVASVVPNPRRALGPEVTQLLLKNDGRHARVIHIATHGLFRRDNPVFSVVRLGDGYLNLTDLYELKLPVELITLSGCATGLTEIAAGDELLGLSRGLLSAGARSIVVTLWDIQDQITASFMRLFYRNWGAHGDKALAIRAAMSEIRAEFSHPYYWAPFVLIGSRKNAQIR